MALKMTITILDSEELAEIVKEYYETVFHTAVSSVSIDVIAKKAVSKDAVDAIAKKVVVQTTIQHELPKRGSFAELMAPAEIKVVAPTEGDAEKLAAHVAEKSAKPTKSQEPPASPGDWVRNPETAGRHHNDTVESVVERAERIEALRKEQELDEARIQKKKNQRSRKTKRR